MITRSEERFIKKWSEQKEGPRWKFYLQYIIAWGIVFFLCLFFFLKLLIANVELGNIRYFLIIFPLSFLMSFIVTHLVYVINEKKLKTLNEKQKSSV